MSIAPTDMLADRHKAYRQAQDRYRRATRAREAAQQRVGELEREVSRAEGRDRVALGDALVDQRRPPKPEADTARQLLERRSGRPRRSPTPNSGRRPPSTSYRNSTERSG